MDPDVKFSCGYKPADANQNPALSCGGIIFSAFFLIVMIAISLLKREWFMLLSLLAFSVLFYGIKWKSSLDQYIHVTATALQIVRADGKVMKEYALSQIREIHVPDRDTVNITVWSDQVHASVEETLRVVADTDGLLAAVVQFGGVNCPVPLLIRKAPLRPEPQPKPQPILQRTLTEEETDELHAAQHLLNQGMISEQQYSDMFVPPVPEHAPVQSADISAADINAQNAADYLQRQAMIAQQRGASPEPAVRDEEQFYGQQSDL